MLDFSIVGGFVDRTLILLLISSIYRNFYKGEVRNILLQIVFKITKNNTSTLENILKKYYDQKKTKKILSILT